MGKITQKIKIKMDRHCIYCTKIIKKRFICDECKKIQKFLYNKKRYLRYRDKNNLKRLIKRQINNSICSFLKNGGFCSNKNILIKYVGQSKKTSCFPCLYKNNRKKCRYFKSVYDIDELKPLLKSSDKNLKRKKH